MQLGRSDELTGSLLQVELDLRLFSSVRQAPRAG
jgi:hypothetical protein